MIVADRKPFDETYEMIEAYDTILLLGCGGCVTVCLTGGERSVSVLAAQLRTSFMGANVAQGEWDERCAACGDCMLAETGGICPVARCSKSLMNGPCGGTNDGKCEIDPDLPCAWALIVERMEQLGRLDELTEVKPPRDWSTSRSGGPRHMKVEEACIDDDTPAPSP